MLAVHGQPFDSDQHFFEIKWDGFRAVAMIEGGAARVMSRNGNDLCASFPALSGLAALGDGLVLDGELVAFRGGKPNFTLVLDRRIPADVSLRFIAFDLLYKDFQSLMPLPFSDRRAALEEVLAPTRLALVMLSEGITGRGTELYRRACEQELEGVVAKRLSSAYAPGKRNGAWIKVKRRLRIQAVIIGFIPKGTADFQSLLVASSGLPGEESGPLRYVGRVGSGFTADTRGKLNEMLRLRPRTLPLVSCPEKGQWVEPELYCTVSFAEITDAGVLRAPVFEGMIEA